MSATGSDGSLDRSSTPHESLIMTASSLRSPHGIWLDGDVLACACPECGAPMSVRLWLAVADCWRCGTSIELTEEQEREAQRLLDEREAAKRRPAATPPVPAKSAPAASPAPAVAPAPAIQPTAVPAPVAIAPTAIAPAASAVPTTAPVPRSTPLPARVLPGPSGPWRDPVSRPADPPGKRLAAATPRPVAQRLAHIQEVGEVEVFFKELFRDLPAWIASLILHMVLLIVLALWVQKEQDSGQVDLTMTLSTQTNQLKKEGEKVQPPEPDPVEFEAPGKDPEPEETPPEKPKKPPEPKKEPNDPGEKHGDQKQLASNPFGGPTSSGSPAILSGRSSQASARAATALAEGGTTQTEAAVKRGLVWLANHQNEDGSWSLDRFHRVEACNGRCQNTGMKSDVAATGLALLPFLGAGQTHREGQYKEEVESALWWLVEQQKSSGQFPSVTGNSAMYAHGQATIALCEAYALTQDERLRGPAQLAVNFIVEAQSKDGGWRYQPRQPGDTSVVGWQLMALRSAQMAYLEVPSDSITRAAKFLDSVQRDKSGSLYAYMPGHGPTPVMTAEALLCRQYSGWQRDETGLVKGVEYLLASHLPNKSNINMYYWYYATQVMHHQGGETWDRWNYRMRDLLVDLQETKGHQAGSWTPRGSHDTAGGRIYMTALAICTLEVYYRHLPLYRQMAIDQ